MITCLLCFFTLSLLDSWYVLLDVYLVIAAKVLLALTTKILDNFADLDDFVYLTDLDDFAVQVPQKSKLADQINYAALLLNLRKLRNIRSRILSFNLDVEAC